MGRAIWRPRYTHAVVVVETSMDSNLGLINLDVLRLYVASVSWIMPLDIYTSSFISLDVSTSQVFQAVPQDMSSSRHPNSDGSGDGLVECFNQAWFA